MSTKVESAELILKLYDLRREAVMREARTWMITFNPESAVEIYNAYMGEHSAHIRMVTTYWDMACSLVNHGAIDEEMFNDANAEHVFIFAKIHPFIEEIRGRTGPQYLSHIEQLVMRLPDAENRMAGLREMSKTMAAGRADAQKKAADESASQAQAGA